MKQIVFTDYRNPPEVVFPEMSDQQITEQTGYATTEQLVELVIRSGEALEDYRHAVFDATHDDEMESVSPFEVDPILLNERIRKRKEIRAQMVEEAKKAQADKEAAIKQGEAKKLAEQAAGSITSPTSPSTQPDGSVS